MQLIFSSKKGILKSKSVIFANVTLAESLSWRVEGERTYTY